MNPQNQNPSIWSSLGLGGFVNGLVNAGKSAYSGAQQFLGSPFFNNPLPGNSPLSQAGNALNPTPPTPTAAPLSTQTYTLNGKQYDAGGAPVPTPTTKAPGSTTQDPAIPTNTGAQLNPTPAGGGNQAVQSGNPGTNPNNIPGGGNNLTNPANPGNPNYAVQGGSALTTVNNQMGGPNTGVPNIDPNNRLSQINAITQNLASGQNATPEETQLTNEIASQQQGLQDTLANNIMTSGDEGILTGRNAAANAQYQGRIQNMTSLLAGLQQQRQLSLQGGQAALGGAEAAAGLQQPVTLNPAQTLVSPYTGQTVGAGGGGGTQATVQSLAQQVASGQMTEQQAQSMLPDNALAGALNQAVMAINPNYSAVQSNVNEAIQGQVGPAAANAQAQITNLGNTLKGMPGLENTGIPFVNTMTRLFSSLTGVGGGTATGLESARQDAISAVTGALEKANGMTPSNAGNLANSYFPPGLTQEQFQNGLTQFQQQIAGKEAAYSNPGAVSPTAGQGNIYNF